MNLRERLQNVVQPATRAWNSWVPTGTTNGSAIPLFKMGREDQPLRAEFLSLDQLERHGRSLANWHQIAEKPRADRLLPRLAENGVVLREAYELMNQAARDGRAIVPAAEWLLDNFYVIETQIRSARQYLPRRYSLELPQLAGGSSDGLPRVYDIAMELISHADGLLDTENLRQFLFAYQLVVPLKLSELWAIPIMLRLALLENLRRIALRTVWQQRDRDEGGQWADRVLQAVERDPKSLIIVLAELIQSDPPTSSSFVAEYTQRLQGRVGQAAVAINWLEHRLTEQGQTVERLIHLNSQTQAADQVSIGNSITSLRSLGALDWRKFVEEQSRVERVLHSDPAAQYQRMNFATRDRYRHAVEQIAKRSPRSEIQVARVAIELAQEARRSHADPGEEHRSRAGAEPDDHVGYYLLDKGRGLLEKSVGYRHTIRDRVTHLAGRFPLTSYLGGAALLWAGLMAAIIAGGFAAGLFATAAPWLFVLPLFLTAWIVGQTSLSIANWFCTVWVPPRPVPQLDFSEEVPLDCRTVVVVPTMLGSMKGIDSLLEHLEVRYLANREQHLHFALLTDFGDADQETLPQDAALIARAKAGIEELNRQYSEDGAGLFYLFHRPRVYNQAEKIWMGRERKRGKLNDFNALLRGGGMQAFSTVVGDLSPLCAARYVITLDTDTQLPRDAAQRLIGSMAHPLNRPRLDPATGRVTRGYAILQPRVAVTVPDGNRSIYSRLFAGDAGIDPYTNQVSDVYQDVFGEGSFIGKGIYDLHAFESALQDRFPNNRILSHDLVESCYARSGLASDIELFEGFPARYLADVSRRHRWVRGDWQLLSWLMPKVPTARGTVSNVLPGLPRWKLFDNLRRSMNTPVLLAVLMLAWLLGPAHALWWTAIVLGLGLLPLLCGAMSGLVQIPAEMPFHLHLQARSREFLQQLAQWGFGWAVLPYEAHWHVDAIARTLYRLFFSRKKMLEWTTASDAERRASGNLRDHYELMFASTVISLGMVALLVIWGRGALPVALPLLVLWLTGPWIAWRVSQPRTVRQPALSEPQQLFLRRIARRTWHYFETFLTDRDHWLAPDNFQEHPVGVLATRTSPTNMGMGLIANLAAWDFGYLSATRMADRIGKTLDAMDQMDRLHGHFYNWYDTRTLQTIEPRYLSSVDSGNLAGLLLTLGAGLERLGEEPVVRKALLDGLSDTLRVATELAEPPAKASGDSLRQSGARDIRHRLDLLAAECRKPLASLSYAHRVLDHLATVSAELTGVPAVHHDARLAPWVRAFEEQCRELKAELMHVAPWAVATAPPEDMAGRASREWRQQLEQIQHKINELDRAATLNKLSVVAYEINEGLLKLVEQWPEATTADPVRNAGALTGPAAWKQYASLFESGAEQASSLLRKLDALAGRCGDFAKMDFRSLYDSQRDLLTIGYNASERRIDSSFYDLLASEARLASFVAISQGQLPRDHWFSLGRMLTTQGGDPTLLSWSGSMFEYLMPMLIMPNYEGTLIDLACRGAVERQIQYGRQQGVPWGVSESCYNVTDVNQIYQYRAFGVPGLGLQRGLGEDLVIAPYASVMGLMFAQQSACKNLELLAASGYLGEYGFVEAIDFTTSRRGAANEPVACQTYMAHHSGMSFLSLASVLLDEPMQRRFLSDPLFKAHDLLLQERVPSVIRPVYPHPAETRDAQTKATDDGTQETATRSFDTPDTTAPEVHLLGNGQYHVMVSNAGGGYSRWNDLAVTRWQPDSTRDAAGQFCYLRDLRSGEYWSTTYQPTLRVPERYHAFFSHGKAEYRRIDDELDVHTTIGVSPEDDLEVRRIIIKNLGRLTRSIELTTYAEAVIAPASSDTAHRAFSNLFVQTEILSERSAILCTRRPRTAKEKPPFLFHIMVSERSRKGRVTFETDRSKFLGRGRSVRDPISLHGSAPLSGTAGAVLDPIVSIRRDMELAGEESVRVDVVTGVATTRQAAMALIEKYQDFRLTDRVFELAWTQEQVVCKQLGASGSDVQTFARLAGPVIYGGPLYRSSPSLLSRNRRNQSHLWAYGISGDLPIVLVKVTDESRLHFVRRMLQAHAYWRLKGLYVDLVIWNDDLSGYRHQMHDALMGLVASSNNASLLDRPGGIFIRRNDQLPEDDRRLLESTAAVVLSDAMGTLGEQLDRPLRIEARLPALRAVRSRKQETERDQPPPRRELAFFNGLGGFTPDGKEFITILRPGMSTPAPWCNVLANDQFGTVVSESGLGYTWFKNAHEYRLTPWHNDPISDPASEAVYVRDEETGRYFCPHPLPARGTRSYVCRHGFGYSVWEYEEMGLQTELTTFVAVDAPVKFLLLKIRNTSGRRRSLTATGYVEWALGEFRSKTGPHVVTEIDPQTGGIFARNYYNIDFNNTVAFMHASEMLRSVTCDRAEFIGRNGTLADPAAMKLARLSGKAGAGLDPCTALQLRLELGEGEEREVMFILGAADDAAQASALLQRFKRVGDGRRTLENVWNFWTHTLSAVHVETPDQRLNALANGWLLYQTLACRFWGRSGFYQSGGAYGFRDQLQDSLALLYSAGHLTREHLLRCANRQFREGDVQHWWHPPTGRGVRTHFSDDYLWLPYVAALYVQITGDSGVLQESAGFLTDRPVAPDEEGYYSLPQSADEAGTLYEHCKRAILYGLKFGSHGLPLMGCGDWNDGMNLVGAEGKGESVWLAFFLYDVLKKFAPLARMRADTEFAEKCLSTAQQLHEAIEQNAWDGQWYRRAYFDNGQPLGSHQNTECQIDALPQSWSVISGAGDPDRMRQAMQSVYEKLVRKDVGLIQLFDPPFDQGTLDPGYIKGYVPGVRENGGQYTHAAIWTVMAYALMGDNARAWECFQLINPLNHAGNETDAAVYKVEPYVVAADVYAVPPQEGRGGWTWYTGSSGWMYRLIIEVLFGLRLEGGTQLSFRPCVPLSWKRYTINYRHHQTFYRIHFTIQSEPTHNVKKVTLDGAELPQGILSLVDDRREHIVEVILGV